MPHFIFPVIRCTWLVEVWDAVAATAFVVILLVTALDPVLEGGGERVNLMCMCFAPFQSTFPEVSNESINFGCWSQLKHISRARFL